MVRAKNVAMNRSLTLALSVLLGCGVLASPAAAAPADPAPRVAASGAVGNDARDTSSADVSVNARWMFDEVSGTPRTTPDDVADDNPMGLHGEADIVADAFMGDGALRLDGLSGYASTSQVPVDTSGSFTAAAWVRAEGEPDGPVALFGAEGRDRDGFGVRYVPHPTDPVGHPGQWQLLLPGTDDEDATVVRLGNSNFYSVTDWNHIAVVHDAVRKETRLYVNAIEEYRNCPDDDGDGRADDETCVPGVLRAHGAGTFTADTSFQVGRFAKDTTGTGHFPGVIDDVWLFRGALNDRQVQELCASWFDFPTVVPGT